MWSHVSDALGQDLRSTFFSKPGLPKRQIREGTETVCRRLKIRHGFGREGEQSWLRTVFLQFGLTRAGYKRLPLWLADNALPPVTIQDLLDGKSHLYSERFATLWHTLQRYRWGFCSRHEAEAGIRGNPWIFDEDPQVILDAAVSRRESERGPATAEEQNEPACALLLPPALRWSGGGPSFEIRLNATPPSWLRNSRYVLTIGAQRLPIIREESGWKSAGLTDSLEVDLSQTSIKVDLLEKGTSVLGDQILLSLAPEVDSFSMYDLGTGRRLDLTVSGAELSRPIAIICRQNLSLSCTSGEFCRVFDGDWICWAFRDGLPSDLKIQDGLILWATASVAKDKNTGVTSSPSILVHSPGGWWGEEVPLAVRAPGEQQLRAIRIGDQVFTLSRDGSGSIRGRMQLLPDQEYSAAQIEYLDGNTLKRLKTEIRIAEVNGVAIESETGWKPLDDSRDIDISYFSTRRLKVKLPSHWRGSNIAPKTGCYWKEIISAIGRGVPSPSWAIHCMESASP
jgi:hypothetical protein